MAHRRATIIKQAFLRANDAFVRRNMSARATSSFHEVPAGPPDPMFVLKQEYDQDSTSYKVDIGAGVLRDEQGACYEFPVIRKAKSIIEKQPLGHDYRPTTGITSFRHHAARLMFGGDSKAIRNKQIASIQTVAGTGACRIGAVFLKKHWPTTLSRQRNEASATVHIGTPTWGNYEPLFWHAGFDKIKTYPYLDAMQNVAMTSTLNALRGAPDRSIFIFQGCCHNPTGRDYSQSEWGLIADVMLSKGHFAFFDTAYQGLGLGIEEDAWAIRHFVAKGVDMLVCQSFSKNAGLYSERVGALHVVCASADIANNVLDQLRSLTRWEVSSAPAYGAELVNALLSDPTTEAQWKTELAMVRGRMRRLREELHAQLTRRLATPSPRDGTIGGWDHLLQENGLFSFTGLSAAQSQILVAQHHIYMPGNGRINISGLNAANTTRVAETFDTVIRGYT
ncbi:pyridoxal phosphate-dependent transferase [Biscogniauxia marginata]|nr:pyridoxal phosphate-dependent transferase [Biscogniauxia marginata]